MEIHSSFVLILNLTVAIVLVLLVLPTLLNTKERLSVRISFSLIFLIIALNCVGYIAIFYYRAYELLGVHFMCLSFNFLYGPAIYFYIKGITEGKIRNLFPHLVLPLVVFFIGVAYNFVDINLHTQIISDIINSTSRPYNFANAAVVFLPLYYIFISRQWLKQYQPLKSDPLYILKSIKKSWATEFLSYMTFCVLSFGFIIIITITIFNLPTVYLNTVALPMHFPFIYAIVAVRSTMISKELEYQYALAKSESEMKLVEQRINISRDLHDNIGAYANSLLVKIDYLQAGEPVSDDYILDLKENAETVTTLLRQTLWVLNNDEINAESSFDYVKQYALKVFRNTGTKVVFKETNSSNIVLDARVATNVYRIVQESLQNIQKHANATVVTVTLNSDEYFSITVEDNGVGLPREADSDGYGIHNMRQRAISCKLEMDIERRDCGGTRVRVRKKFA